MKHQILEAALIELINSGEKTAPDGRFLSEREISERFQVGRTTVRTALTNLCKQGYLIQIHGKGTFVKRQERSQSLYSVIRCTQTYAAMGLTPNTTVLKREVIPASAAVAHNLKIKENTPVLFLVKLFQGNRTIFNVAFSFLPLTRFPNIVNCDFSSVPIMDVLRAQYAVLPRRTENSIEAILPPQDVADYLKVSQSTPIMLFESVTSGSFNGDYIPLEYFKCYHKTDVLRFSFTQEYDMPY